MLETIRLILLRRKARSLVGQVYAIMSKYDCGNRLTLELRPDVWTIARKADKTLDEIQKIEPKAHVGSRITPMLERIAK